MKEEERLHGGRGFLYQMMGCYKSQPELHPSHYYRRYVSQRDVFGRLVMGKATTNQRSNGCKQVQSLVS